MGRTYYCWKCQDRHAAPSGRNCPARSPFDEDSDSETNDIIHFKQPVDGDTTKLTTSHNEKMDNQLPLPPSEAKVLSSRLDNLEELLYKLTENLSKDPAVTDKLSRSTSPIRSSSSSPDDRSRPRRRHRHHRTHSPSPSKFNDFDYSMVFDQEDIKISTFSQVMVATFRNLISLYESGTDILGLLQHGRYMSEKASAEVYVMDAFVGFDKFARAVANRKGPSAFGDISDLDKNRYFSLENYRDVRALKSKVHKAQSQPKKTGTCRRFNGENGCWAKGCPYVHQCLACSSADHSVVDCPAIKKGKPNK